MSSFLLELKADLLDLLKLSAGIVSRRKILFFVVLPLAAIVGANLLFPWDVGLSDGFKDCKKESRQTYDLMKMVSRYGGFGGVAAGCAVVFAAGKYFGRRRIVLAGLSGLLAASAAGLFDNAVRFSTGRPRPKARIEDRLPDKFHGPSFKSDFQSFPSAHTATSFGAAAGVAFVSAPLAVPAFAGTALVAFSRVYILAHYPSDVFAGALIGLWFGLAFAFAARGCLSKEA